MQQSTGPAGGSWYPLGAKISEVWGKTVKDVAEWIPLANGERLSADAVAYFNIDTYTAGTLDVTGSPALRELVQGAAQQVRDPVTGRTMAAEWQDRARGAVVGDIGAGSDWTAFLHHAGVPSLQWTMNGRGTYAVYHSSLDDDDYGRISLLWSAIFITAAMLAVLGAQIVGKARACDGAERRGVADRQVRDLVAPVGREHRKYPGIDRQLARRPLRLPYRAPMSRVPSRRVR